MKKKRRRNNHTQVLFSLFFCKSSFFIYCDLLRNRFVYCRFFPLFSIHVSDMFLPSVEYNF
jgi:hypothetical protein